MTSSSPPPEQPGPPPPAPAAPPPPPAPPTPAAYAPVPETPLDRPGVVTGAAITMIVVGVLISLFGILLLFAGAIIGGAAGSFDFVVPGLGGYAGAAAGVLIVLAVIVLAIGILDVVAAINVFAGRSWARWTGIVLAILLIVFSLGSLASRDGVVFGLIWMAANAFVVYALAAGGRWFAPRST